LDRCRAAAQDGRREGVVRRRCDFENAAAVVDVFERVAQERSQFIEEQVANLKRRQSLLRERQITMPKLQGADGVREIVAVIGHSAKERAGRNCVAFRNQIAEWSQETVPMINMLDLRIHEFVRVMKLRTGPKRMRQYDDRLVFTSNRFEPSGIEY
jgi:hypothetical protein